MAIIVSTSTGHSSSSSSIVPCSIEEHIDINDSQTQEFIEFPPSQPSQAAPPEYPNLQKIVDVFLETIKNVSREAAAERIRTILDLQETPRYVSELVRSPSLPYDILIFPKCFVVDGVSIGKGAESDVHSSWLIATKPMDFDGVHLSPCKTMRVASKRARSTRSTFSPQKRQRGLLTPQRKSKVDAPLITGRLRTGEAVAIHKLFKSDLAHINYREVDKPALHLMQILSDVLEGLEGWHKRGLAHRDLKLPNMLCINSDGAITDHSTLRNTDIAPKHTRGTPRYLNPKGSFGDAESNLINQKNRVGMQRLEDDMHAFFLSTLQAITRLARQFNPNDQTQIDLFQDVRKALYPKNHKFTDEELREIGKEYPFRSFYINTIHNCRFVEYVIVFPEMSDRRKKLLADLNSGLTLKNEDLDALKVLANFCIDNLEADDSKRLNATQAKRAFKAITDHMFLAREHARYSPDQMSEHLTKLASTPPARRSLRLLTRAASKNSLDHQEVQTVCYGDLLQNPTSGDR